MEINFIHIELLLFFNFYSPPFNSPSLTKLKRWKRIYQIALLFFKREGMGMSLSPEGAKYNSTGLSPHKLKVKSYKLKVPWEQSIIYQRYFMNFVQILCVFGGIIQFRTITIVQNIFWYYMKNINNSNEKQRWKNRGGLHFQTLKF